MKTISIHQPNYLPWLGYFYKINTSDLFVLLDDVDFQQGNATSLTNRTRINGPNGPYRITVPVRKIKEDRRICDVRIDNTQPWDMKHEKSLKNSYASAPYYNRYCDDILEIIHGSKASLSELNAQLIFYLCKCLDIKTEIVFSSQLQVQDVKKDNRIVEICRYLGATHYLSGEGARKYNRPEMFASAGLVLNYSRFSHPVYQQNFGPFIPGLSVVDALFNAGPGAKEFIKPQP